MLDTPVEVATFGGGPASTIVLGIVRFNPDIHVNECALAWVGDSRAYLLTAAVPETLLTHDDSWASQEVDAGRMSEAEALADPNAHAIVQWLGMSLSEMTINTKETAVPPGSTLLLCSDGLWNYLEEPTQMARLYTEVSRDADAVEICRRMVQYANDSGGADNVTVGLLRAG